MVEPGGRGELRLPGARCRVKKKPEPAVLEDDLGGSGRAGFPKAHPAALRQQLTTVVGVLPRIALGAERVSGPSVHPKCRSFHCHQG